MKYASAHNIRANLVSDPNVGEGFYVYALKHGREVFYIGKGRDRRWKAHFQDHSLKNHSHKNAKIKKINSCGEKVNVEILARHLSQEQAILFEAELIAIYGLSREGGMLTNILEADIIKGGVHAPWDDARRAKHRLNARGNNASTSDDVVKRAKLLCHYRGMDYQAISEQEGFEGVDAGTIKQWCNGGSRGHIMPHLKSMHGIRQEQKKECYDLWKKGFEQSQVAEILGIPFWKTKRLIQHYQKENPELTNK